MESTALMFPSRLFRNDGEGRFEDVAQAAGVTNMRYCKGSAWGDYDNDGYADLYISNFGEDNRLYRNNGNGTFSDVAPELGLTQPLDSFATWFWDYDNDGWQDIFVAGYGEDIADVAADYMGLPNDGARPRLYRNDGAGGFTDVTREVGLWRVHLAMGADFGDLDNDGYPDFYLGTGAPSYDAIAPNVMYRNDSGKAISGCYLLRWVRAFAEGAWGIIRGLGQGRRPRPVRASRRVLSGRRVRERAVQEPGAWQSVAVRQADWRGIEQSGDWGACEGGLWRIRTARLEAYIRPSATAAASAARR